MRASSADSSPTDPLAAFLVTGQASSGLKSFQKFIGFLAHHDGTVDYGIEGGAISTLHAEKMPSPGVLGLFAVDATNIYNPG